MKCPDFSSNVIYGAILYLIAPVTDCSTHGGIMRKASIFISHISEEAELATLLKRHLIKDFLGLFNVFVSSDTVSISAGSKWLDSIESALQDAKTELVLCSKISIKRPWINFEAGAGWMRNIPIVPICHSGLRLRDLGAPLSFLQGIEAAKESGIEQIYKLLAETLEVDKPAVNTKEIVDEIKAFEERYIPDLEKTIASQTSRESAALERIKDILKEEGYVWRRIDTLATKGGITRGEALDILRADKNVVFGKNKRGTILAKLKSK
jgi:hypothetical protein